MKKFEVEIEYKVVLTEATVVVIEAEDADEAYSIAMSMPIDDDTTCVDSRVDDVYVEVVGELED